MLHTGFGKSQQDRKPHHNLQSHVNHATTNVATKTHACMRAVKSPPWLIRPQKLPPWDRIVQKGRHHLSQQRTPSVTIRIRRREDLATCRDKTKCLHSCCKIGVLVSKDELMVHHDLHSAQPPMDQPVTHTNFTPAHSIDAHPDMTTITCTNTENRIHAHAIETNSSERSLARPTRLMPHTQPPPQGSNSDPNATETANRDNYRPCKHQCGNKTLCKHKCCKEGVRISPTANINHSWSLRNLIPWTSASTDVTEIPTAETPTTRTETTEGTKGEIPLPNTQPPGTAPNEPSPSNENDVSRDTRPRRPCKHKCKDKSQCQHACCQKGALVRAGEIACSAISWTVRNLLILDRPTQPTALPAPQEVQPSSQPEPLADRFPTTPVSDSPPHPANAALSTERRPDPISDRSYHNGAHTIFQRTPRTNTSHTTPPCPRSELESLLETFRTIQGGRALVHFDTSQWDLTISRIEGRCNAFMHPARSKEDALFQAEVISAILAVSVYETAKEINPTRGFLLRTRTGRSKRSSRPLAIDRTVKSLNLHVRQLKRSLTFMHGPERNAQRGRIKEAHKALKLYEEEARLQKMEIERRWAQTQFQRNPWTAAGECLDHHDVDRDGKDSLYPTVPIQEVERFFETSLTKPDGTFSIPPDEFTEPRPREHMEWVEIDGPTVAAAISSKRSGAAPGSDTITNILLKRCPSIYSVVAQVFNDILKFGVCPPTWKTAVTRLIHKGGDTKLMENWRPISLTSCLGKLFHSIISHRILHHALDSHAIDTSIQKGFLPHMNGTVEHTQVLCELLEYQRRHKRQYCLAQFDIKNAFGSVPHTVLLQALKWARVSPIIVQYIEQLYEKASIQIKCAEGLTKPIPIDRGVLQGDTLSPILFNLAMELVLRFVRSSCPQYGITWDDKETFLKAFADDLTIITNTPREMQNATNVLVKGLSDIGMNLNVKKCRIQHMSMTQDSGYMTRRPQLTINGAPIPQICDKGSTFLGMTLAPGAQQGKNLFQKLRARLRMSLQNITNSAHDLPARLWIYNQGVISRLRYSLVVNTCLSFNHVLRLQRYATQAIRKWLNLAKTATSELLYSEHGWNLMSLSKLWLLCTAQTTQQMEKSKDPAVKYSLRERIRREQAKRQSGHIRPSIDIQSLQGGNVRRVLATEYERHLSQAVQRRTTVAGQWFRMATEADLARDFAAALCNLKSESLSRFTASVITQTPLPTRASLRKWGVSTHTSDKCPICRTETQTTLHILSGCAKSLEQGRYTLRHDLVLQTLAYCVANSPATRLAHFDLPQFRSTPSWLTNLDTELRPDGWVKLASGEEYIIELTCPWEENFAYAHERKMNKYTNIYHSRKLEHPATFLLVFEVGARGKLHSSARALNSLFLGNDSLIEACRQSMTQSALRGIFQIFQHRDEVNWIHDPNSNVA